MTLLRSAALISQTPSTDGAKPAISDDQWRNWLNSPAPMHHAPEMGDDPHEGLFVAEIPFIGGGYLSVPSDSPEDPFVIESLLEGILMRMEDVTDENVRSFVKRAVETAFLALTVSHRVLTAAGLTRHTLPGHSESGEILWPSGDPARSVQSAVRISRSELSALLEQHRVTDRALTDLGFRRGELPADYRIPNDNPMRSRPILVLDDSIVLVSPCSLLPALRNAIFNLAADFDVLSEVLEAYRIAVQCRIDLHIDLMNWETPARRSFTWDSTRVEVWSHTVDKDKVVVTYTVCDDIQQGLWTDDDRHWDIASVVNKIDRFREKTDIEFFDRNAPWAEIVHVLIVQGVGRWSITGGLKKSENERSLNVLLTADDFCVFSLLNISDPLALWHVARAWADLPQSMGMMAGFLDHYALFRSKEKSYYFSDDGMPDFALFIGGSGIGLRLDVQMKLDPHTVRWPVEQACGKVYRLQQRGDMPIYTALPSTSDDIQLLVEGLKCPVWVLPDNSPLESRQSQLGPLDYHLADVVAFWIWQATPYINELLAENDFDEKELHISVKAFNVSDWGRDRDTLEPPYGIDVRHTSVSQLAIQFGPEFSAAQSHKNNLGERALLAGLLQGFSSLLGQDTENGRIDNAVDTYAPLGIKRRFMVLHGLLKETLPGAGLPRVRHVQSFDEHAIADSLGRELQNTLQKTTRDLPEGERHEACNKVVSWLFSQFETIIKELSPENLVLDLIIRQEAVIADRRMLELIFATHVACFGDTPEVRSEIQGDMAAADKAAMSSRFLIEYVAACPPDGRRPLSLATYDRLIALASEIIYFGRLSDLYRYQLSNHSIELLGSGRLRIEDKRFDAAMTDFKSGFDSRQAEGRHDDHKRLLEQSRPAPGLEPTADIEELEAVTRAEFGLSITELGRMLGAINASPFTQEAGDGCCSEPDLIEYLSNHTENAESKIRAAMALLTLRSRPQFLKTPTPYSGADVYPWRFNRGLSYLRKPFVATGSDEPVLYWGSRAIRMTADYLLGLCTGGRLKNIHSAEMRTYQGKLIKRAGDRFNMYLGETISAERRYVVRTKMRKFAGKKIQRTNRDELGDIDVLVAATERRQLFALEAKSFSLAKTPSELANERDELFGELADNGGAVGRHLERCSWLETHTDDVLNELKIDNPDDNQWDVVPVLVLDTDLVTPRLVNPPFSVVVAADIVGFLDDYKGE